MDVLNLPCVRKRERIAMIAIGTEPTTRTALDEIGGLRILIAEDHEDGAESMAILLRLFGHSVVIVQNGPAALEYARINKPDVVLLDLGLPLMNGFDVAKRLSKPRPRKTPLLIAVTGWGREEDRRNSREAGIDLHLLKPVDPVALQCVLTRFQALIKEMRPEYDKDAPGWGC
jgi:two-component system, OmpR family, response regulator